MVEDMNRDSFPPELVVNGDNRVGSGPPARERMKLPYMTDQCELMLKISSEFVRLQVSHDEYLCMKVLLLLSTGQPAHRPQ